MIETQKKLFMIGFPSVAGDRIDVGLKQVRQEAEIILR